MGGKHAIEHWLSMLGSCQRCHRLIHDGNFPRHAELCVAACFHGLKLAEFREMLWKLERGEQP
jgi:hypothetical protein